MHTSIVQKRTNALLSEDFIRHYLRLSAKEDSALILHLLDVATDWVEDQLNKTLMVQKRKVAHRNHRFALPYGPIVEVLEVQVKGKKVGQEDYTLAPTIGGDSLVLTLPFQWKSPEVTVIYTAGYGHETADVPPVLRHAVLEILALLYEHRGDVSILQDYVAPWLQQQKLYHLA